MNEKRAQCVVQSWLLSWGVPYEIREGKLVADGREVEYDAATILSTDFNESMAEMERIMERLDRPMPALLRSPTCRRAAGDDLVARSLRLTAFAKTANPPADVLAKFAPVVKREADRAHRLFSNLTRSLLLEPRDYFAAGMVFLVLYLHRYQDLDSASRNGADLTRYLQQEFRHWDKVLHHDLPSIVLDARGMLPEQFMSAPVPGSTLNWDTYAPGRHDDEDTTAEPSYTMPEYATPEPDDAPDVYQEGDLPHHLLPELLTVKEYRAHVKRCPACSCEKQASRDAKGRRQAARQRLVDSLDGLPHDEMVDRLTFAAENMYLDFDVRTLAAKLYVTHAGKCATCSAKHPGLVDTSPAVA